MPHDVSQKLALIAYLESHLTQNKREKMAAVLKDRTKHVTIILEDHYQGHNASAIVRTVECFGIQDVHVVQQKNKFNVNTSVAMGSSHWVSLHKHTTIGDAYGELKKQGYRIVATAPAVDNAYCLERLPLESKFALVFGTEDKGLSQQALELADEFVTIPMYGFTQSLNVSVTAGICMHYITLKLRSSDIDWRLSQEQALEVHLSWLRNQIRGVDEYERLFAKKREK